MIHKDIFNKTIKPGDFLIYAAALGRSSILKVAKVLELREKHGVLKISVTTATNHWNVGWTLQKNGGPVTLELLDRMMVVTPDTLPKKVVFLLGGEA